MALSGRPWLKRRAPDGSSSVQAPGHEAALPGPCHHTAPGPARGPCAAMAWDRDSAIGDTFVVPGGHQHDPGVAGPRIAGDDERVRRGGPGDEGPGAVRLCGRG